MIFALSLLWACSGDNGSAGPSGPSGPAGPAGPAGPPAPTDDPVTAAVQAAKVEACATCHGGVGEGEHQSVYDKYVDASTLALTFDSLTSAANGANFTVTLTYSITKNGASFIDAAGLPSFDQVRFEAVSYDSGTGLYLTECRLNENHVALGGGRYTVQDTNCPYQPDQQTTGTLGAHVYGYIAQGALLAHEGGSSELPQGSHVHLYDDVASAALAYGTADAANGNSYASAANVAGCENCHGTPYRKHGYRDPIVAGLPDFASCKSCHYDDRTGGHEDWQYMVDDPVNWSTAALDSTTVETRYAYKAKLMNVVHMAHSMEFPYPRSMANCATCHGPVKDDAGVIIPGTDKLAQILDNSNYTAETCKSCHPVEGLNAWPEDVGTVLEGAYAQGERAPPLRYLWAKHGVESVHDINAVCTTCHGNPAVPNAPALSELHTGYDVRIANENGEKYRDLFTASIDDVSVDLVSNMLTIAYSADESAILNAVPGSLDVHVYVSFFGWDSKHFIVPSHTRDVNSNRFEFNPPNLDPPLFPTYTEVAPGSWTLMVDMAAWVGGDGGFIPDLIVDGTIRKAMITLAPRLNVVGHDDEDLPANLDAVTRTVDLGTATFVDNYFKGTNATVDESKCEKCHDQLAVTWHTGSGRGGDIMACKNCHNPTYAGSHVEMASRSVENYVHAIHSFQDFDIDDVFHDDAEPDDPTHGENLDPVLAKRYDQHINHVFPNFTIRNCEACHLDGTFDVPDQTRSMPGLLSAAQSVDTWYEMVDTAPGSIPDSIALLKPEGRNIKSVPEAVVGPASRSCGGCHRANLIKADDAGGLAAFNAHTESGGTYVENDSANNAPDDPDDEILFGIIDKIMSLFE